MTKLVEKRTVDMEVSGEWVNPGSRVLDLGCGKGALLHYLVQTKDAAGVGVDLDFGRITAAVARGNQIEKSTAVDSWRSRKARTRA